MPARDVTCGNVINLNRHDSGPCVIGQQTNDGMQRTHPAQCPCPPTHGFGPWEIANGIFQYLGMAEAQNIIEWVGSTDEDSHPVYYITPVTEYMLAQAYHPYADDAEECDDDDS